MVTISEATHNQMIRLGQRLRRARMARGLSMAAFARQMGVSAAALRRMELGRPDVSLGRWAEVLHRLNGPGDMDGLLSATGPQTPYMHQNHPRGLRQRTV